MYTSIRTLIAVKINGRIQRDRGSTLSENSRYSSVFTDRFFFPTVNWLLKEVHKYWEKCVFYCFNRVFPNEILYNSSEFKIKMCKKWHIFEPTTSCLRVRGASRAPQRHRQQKEHLIGSQFMLQWFMTFYGIVQNAPSSRKNSNIYHKSSANLTHGFFPILCWIQYVTWINWTQLEPVKHNQRLL